MHLPIANATGLTLLKVVSGPDSKCHSVSYHIQCLPLRCLFVAYGAPIDDLPFAELVKHLPKYYAAVRSGAGCAVLQLSQLGCTGTMIHVAFPQWQHVSLLLHHVLNRIVFARGSACWQAEAFHSNCCCSRCQGSGYSCRASRQRPGTGPSTNQCASRKSLCLSLLFYMSASL